MLTPIRARHPLLLSVGLTLGLLLAVALAGTAVYMLHLPLPTPVPLAFVPHRSRPRHLGQAIPPME
jgi:hypothetical protein